MGGINRSLTFAHLSTPDGWLSPGRVDIEDDGTIAAVAAGDAAFALPGTALAGMPNLHSHAFQRAMAGLTERAGPGEDSFWTWREVMYGFVGRLEPEDVEAIAAQLYVEMLKAGYTAVGEFHYLHHDRDGTPYGDVAEMAGRVTAAARRAGIAITLLPVLYDSGGFGGAPPAGEQRRFLNGADRLLRIIETMTERHRTDAEVRVGLAPHSLRAASPAALETAIAGLDGLDPSAPIHIHIAEQTREVEDCLAWSGKRPVAWLFDNHPIGPRWCLVHATHIDPDERRALSGSGAVAGLCPTTEANLGDGIFPLQAFLADGGRFGVGSDSHVSVSPVEELRWLEYAQRLTTRRRTVSAPPEGSNGARLYHEAISAGAQALGRRAGGIAPGNRADIIVLDHAHPLLVGRTGDRLLDSYLFAGNENLVRDVMVGGRWVVREGRHENEQPIAQAYRRVISRLFG